MKHLRRIWRETLRPLWFDYEWPVIGVIGALVVLLGAYGFHLHFQQQNLALAPGTRRPVEVVDVLFKAFQLFVLQINVDPPMPWQLNLARLLAPVVAAYTALQALGQIFAEQARSLRLRFHRNHVIICGLGRKGLTLARGFLERGQQVVVIEQDAENDLVRQCRDLGGVVLIGDAAEPRLLRKAGLARARHLFALCGDDGSNAEVAVRAAQLVASRTGPPLTCILHIFDPQLCTLLRERELDATATNRLRLEFFNVYELGARVLLEENPLPAPPPSGTDTPAPHLVIVGLGRLGESLLINAARQWHARGTPARPKLRVTLVDQRAADIASALTVRHPGLKGCCELRPLSLDVRSGTFLQPDLLACPEPGGPPAPVFVCLDNDSLSLSTALALVRPQTEMPPTVVVRMAQDAGLAVLLREADACPASFQRLRAFGLLDRTCHPDQVLRGTHEILARAIHDEYLRQQAAAGVTPQQNPSLVPWEQLPEPLREANRQEADDIGVKLRAVDCSAAPQPDWTEPLFEFTPDEVRRLERLNHEHWMAAREREGWRRGPVKDTTSRTHPCLVPYEQLPPEEQEKNRASVRQIPAALARVGFRVHRLTRGTRPPSSPERG